MIYDKAHDLARALKESREYLALLAAQQAMADDAAARKMVRDFIVKKTEAEYRAMSGQEEGKAQLEQLQQMYDLLSQNGKAKEFLEAYIRCQRIMADVSKIIGGAVAEGLDLFAKD